MTRTPCPPKKLWIKLDNKIIHLSKSQNKCNSASATQNIPSRFPSASARLFTVAAAAAKTGTVSEKIPRESQTKRLINEKPFFLLFISYQMRRGIKIQAHSSPSLGGKRDGESERRPLQNFLTRLSRPQVQTNKSQRRQLKQMEHICLKIARLLAEVHASGIKGSIYSCHVHRPEWKSLKSIH